jgi:hypothetical protein
MEKLKEYLWNEWRYNNAPKFLKYFEEWFENLTDLQILQYTAYMEGDKTIL